MRNSTHNVQLEDFADVRSKTRQTESEDELYLAAMLADGLADNAIGIVEGEEVEDARHHATPLCALVADGLQVACHCVLQPGLSIPIRCIRLCLQANLDLTAANYGRQSIISASGAATSRAHG